MKEQYKNIGSVVIRTIEECSELIHILSKAERFGMNNYHPADEHMTSNRKLIEMEIEDVREVLKELEKHLEKND